jgi:hypothetical protein
VRHLEKRKFQLTKKSLAPVTDESEDKAEDEEYGEEE